MGQREVARTWQSQRNHLCRVLHWMWTLCQPSSKGQLMRAGDQVARQGQMLSCRRGQHLQPLLKNPCRTWTSSGPCGQHTSYFSP